MNLRKTIEEIIVRDVGGTMYTYDKKKIVEALLSAIQKAMPKEKKPSKKVDAGNFTYYEETPKEYGWNAYRTALLEKIK